MKAILLVVLVLSAAAAENNLKFFDQLSNSEFGKTLLQTIQLELSGNTLERVLAFLKQMKVDIQTAQNEQDAQYKERSANINKQLGLAEQVITKAKEHKAADEQQLPLRQEELTNKINQAEDKNGEKQRNLDRIAQLTQEREETRKEFEQRRSEIVGLVVALQQGKQLIQEVRTGSFIEELEHHHKNFMKRFPDHRGYNSLVSLSMLMAQDPALKSDQTMMERVLSVFDDLAENLYAQQKQEIEADDAREVAFLTAKARFENANQHLEGSVATLQAAVEVLQQKMLELKNDINMQELVIKNKSVEKADWNKSSKDENSGYSKQSDNRKEELSLVVQSLAVFEGGVTQAETQYIQRIQIK